MESQALTRRKATTVRLLLSGVPVIDMYLEFKSDLCYNNITKRRGDCYEEKGTRTLQNYFPRWQRYI